jgi:hypothetical protein
MAQSVFLECPHRLPHFAPCCIDVFFAQMIFYLQNTKTSMVLDIKGERGPEVIMYPYHGGTNQLWEYKNGMIYSRLNG